MKKIVLGILAFAIVFAKGAIAHEGSAEIAGGSANCKVTSVWREDDYRIIGKCSGLVYPYETQYEHYFLWVRDEARNTMVRVGEIDRGYVEGKTSAAFREILVTAEQDNNPHRPSEKEIASGTLATFSFDKTEVKQSTTPMTSTSLGTRTVQNGATEDTEAGASVGSVVGKIFAALLTIILVVIAMVVVGSLVFRRRGSVSG